MSALRIDRGAVVLAGEHLAAAREAVRIARAARARNGLPEARALAELAGLLAPGPQRDAPEQPQEHAEPMTTRQAADVLGVSPRQVRRLASRLGGYTLAGRLVLDPEAVRQHHAGRTTAA